MLKWEKTWLWWIVAPLTPSPMLRGPRAEHVCICVKGRGLMCHIFTIHWSAGPGLYGQVEAIVISVACHTAVARRESNYLTLLVPLPPSLFDSNSRAEVSNYFGELLDAQRNRNLLSQRSNWRTPLELESSATDRGRSDSGLYVLKHLESSPSRNLSSTLVSSIESKCERRHAVIERENSLAVLRRTCYNCETCVLPQHWLGGRGSKSFAFNCCLGDLGGNLSSASSTHAVECFL